MPELIVRIKKKTNGEAALTCERADGSVTWQRQEGQVARFFPPHDLTHFAVESVLGFDHAFYGLIANGWDISDFAAPGTKDRLPEQALLAEMLVIFLDLERITGVVDTAAEFEWKIAAYRDEHHLPPTRFHLTDDQLSRIRERRDGLLAQWSDVAAGDALELRFA